ncbi:hypothetical protein ACS0TY_035099 [Phlomoides rotata]
MEARTLRAISLVLNCFLLGIGVCGGPLIMRLYFIRGGKRIWFSAWLETGGFPIILIPVLVSYFRRRSTTTEAKLFLITPRIFAAGAGIGLLMGIDNYMYAYGVAKLPVSTSSLLIASQLVFMAGFAYVLVKQKLTAYSVNAVVLLTVGAVILGMNTGSDRPKGESNKMYWLGFILTLLAAVMYGLILPLVELVYQRAKQAITYTLVMEFQAVMGIFATTFCTVGMIVNKDFQVCTFCSSSSGPRADPYRGWVGCSTPPPKKKKNSRFFLYKKKKKKLQPPFQIRTHDLSKIFLSIYH